MDTLTHALSGALLARASAPRQARIPIAARVGAGFFASAFPDVDWVLSYVSPVAYLTQHRGVTHSLFLMPLWALMLAWLFARIDRGKPTSWRDYLGVCLLALAVHITGDLITSFGTMIYAPFSNERVAWSTTFIIDLGFTGIIVAGLAASLIWRRSRVSATLALTVLAGYVGMQALAREGALDFGERYAEARAFRDARVSAIPRPVSPFNWMVMVSEGDRYHYANVNLVRKTVPTLCARLLGMEQNREAEVRALTEQYGDEPRDWGDEGANMAQIDIDQALHHAGDRRLATVERALEKIREGTYGLSDASGEPIPRVRLEVVPDAIYTGRGGRAART